MSFVHIGSRGLLLPVSLGNYFEIDCCAEEHSYFTCHHVLVNIPINTPSKPPDRIAGRVKVTLQQEFSRELILIFPRHFTEKPQNALKMKKTRQNELFLPFKYQFSEIIPVILARTFRHFYLA